MAKVSLVGALNQLRQNIQSWCINNFVTKHELVVGQSGAINFMNYCRMSASDTDIVFHTVEDKTITALQIHPDVTYIGRQDDTTGVCENLVNLTAIGIPQGTKIIGARAFKGCSGLTNITFPNSITNISQSSLNGCSGLTSITIPFVGLQDYATADTWSAFGYIFGTESYEGSTAVKHRIYNIQYPSQDIFEYTAYVPTSLKHVKVLGGELPRSAFQNCSMLETVELPSNITEVSRECFEGCSGLKTITIPSGVTKIDFQAFMDCSNLESIYLGPNVTEFVDMTFYGCDKLTSVHIPDIANWWNVTDTYDTLEGANLYDNNGIVKNLTVPSSVTSVTEHLFDGCTSIESVHIPSHVKTIGLGAFSCPNINKVSCDSLEDWLSIQFTYHSLAIEDSTPTYYAEDLYVGENVVTSVAVPANKQLSPAAFFNCKSIETVSMTNSITKLPEYVFAGCTGLSRIDYAGTTAEWSTLTKIVTWNKDVTNCAVYCTDGITSMNGELINNITITSTNRNVIGFVEGETTILNIPTIVYDNTTPYKVTAIDTSAFSDCSSLTNVTMSDSITSIGSYAFQRCSDLQSVSLSPSITSLSEGIFDSCSKLTDINLDNIVLVDGYAFQGCTSLTSLQLPDVTSLQTGSLKDCSGLISIDLGGNVSYLGVECLMNCSNLTTINFNETQEKWRNISKATDWNENTGEYTVICTDGQILPIDVGSSIGLSYTNNESYISVSGIGTCDDTALNITSQRKGVPVSRIDANAFRSNDKITSVTMPDSITSVGTYAFSHCSALTSVQLSENDTRLDEGVFVGCSKLSTIDLSNITWVRSNALQDTGLTSVYLPNVTIIESQALKGCSSLTEITLSSTLTSLGQECLMDCSSLTTINFDGTLEQWYNVPKATDWDKNTSNYTIVCSDGQVKKGELEKPTIYIHYGDTLVTNVSIDPDKVYKVTLPSHTDKLHITGTYKITSQQFEGNYSIEDVEVPDQTFYIKVNTLMTTFQDMDLSYVTAMYYYLGVDENNLVKHTFPVETVSSELIKGNVLTVTLRNVVSVEE